MGRPPINIDWDLFDSLCQMHCTEEEFAYFFKCSVDTLNNKCKEQFGRTFSEVYEEKAVGGRMSLRRQLWQNALGDKREGIKPHAATAIFLSKQKPVRGGLGFSDKIDSTVSTGEGEYEKLMGICSELERKKAEEPR